MAEIFHRVEVRVPMNRVIPALTEQAGLARWWTADTRAEAKQGAIAEFRFFDGKFVVKMKVEELSANQVRWRVIEGPEDWVGTEIVYALAPAESGADGTVVRFRHRGWRDGVDFMGHCSAKWAYFLLGLKAYLEGGNGTPHPNDLSI